MRARRPPGPLGARDRSAEGRILEAVTVVVDEVGYAHLTVQRILDAASVSRATFYQYFSNVDDCFWCAYRGHVEELVGEVMAAVRGSDDPELAVIDVLVGFAISRPAVARLLMREGLAAGPVGLVERDCLILAIRQSLSTAAAPGRIDLPPAVLIGGTFRLLAMRLSAGTASGSLYGELHEWAAAFPMDPSRPSWSERLTPKLPDTVPPISLSGMRPQGPARERILRGTALAIRAKGYQAITVNDIVGAAGVSRRRFYDEFASKADAFIAAYEQGFQQTMAACAPAFFAPRAWRERVWQGGLAFTSFLAREPLIAHLGFIECYAIGPRFTLRVHDIQMAFTLFLEDGYRERSEAEGLSRAHSALAAAAIFEIAFQAGRRGSGFDIRRCQPLAVYVALAPFIGREEAGEFVIGKLAGSASGASAAA